MNKARLKTELHRWIGDKRELRERGKGFGLSVKKKVIYSNIVRIKGTRHKTGGGGAENDREKRSGKE